jgi:uncharacterized protein Yka (UPF0111/DUF47 family)
MALLGLLFGGVGDDESRRRSLFRLVRADNDSIVEGVQFHDVVASVANISDRVLRLAVSPVDC